MILTLNCFLLWPELAFGVPGESTKGHEIMERGLQKLTNTTPPPSGTHLAQK